MHYRALTAHPSDNRFTPRAFTEELERQCFRVVGGVVERWFGDFMFGVARRGR